MKKLATLTALALLPLLAACNTMEGAGKDIQKGGEKLEESAEKNRNY
jgi:predicted small secreted protein